MVFCNSSRDETEDTLPTQRLHWTHVADNLDPSLLVKNPVDSFDRKIIYPNPKTAALASMKHLLNYENYSFTLEKPEWRTKANKPYKTVTLYILDRHDKILQKITAEIPLPENVKLKKAQAWAVDLPLLGFHQLPLWSDTIGVYWRDNMGKQGVITFTYPVEDGYSAIEGFAVNLK